MTATQLVTADELYQMGSDAPYELMGRGTERGVAIESKSSEIGVCARYAVASYVDGTESWIRDWF